jgi:hypothetical protein
MSGEPQVRALLAGPRCLVYLEGCENAEDSARFLNLCGNATVLLTSRAQNDTKGSVARKIRPIHVNDAAEILIWHAKNGWDPPLAAAPGRKTIWRRISTLLGRHPLALRLAGHHLGTGEQSATEFVEVLEKQALVISMITAVPRNRLIYFFITVAAGSVLTAEVRGLLFHCTPLRRSRHHRNPLPWG